MTDLETEVKLIDAYWGIFDRVYINKILPLVWMIKNGEISQPVVIHNKPDDYGLKQADSVKIRIKCLRQQAKDLKDEYLVIKAQYLRGERPEAHIPLNSLSEQIEKLNKAIYFNRQRLKGDTTCEQYDLETIKRVPINQITEIMLNGFFRNNPFRNEKSPSNSLYLYKNKNRFCDFATGKTGDVVDVYMAVNNCDMRTAMKELNNLI